MTTEAHRRRLMPLGGMILITLSLGLLTWRVTALESWQAEDRGHMEILIAHEHEEASEISEILAIEKTHDAMLAECIRGRGGDHDPVQHEVQDKAR